jgi:hypothetical protein
MGILIRRDCASDPNSCEKPVSDFLKTGVPGIIVGVYVQSQSLLPFIQEIYSY